MTEIEKLEREIADKKAELKRLKAELNPTLDFRKYKEYGVEKYPGSLTFTHVTDDLRALVARIVVVKEEKRSINDEIFLYANANKIRLKDLSKDQIRLANDLLNELYPIIAKYIDIAVEKNRVMEG